MTVHLGVGEEFVVDELGHAEGTQGSIDKGDAASLDGVFDGELDSHEDGRLHDVRIGEEQVFDFLQVAGRCLFNHKLNST